MLLQDSFVQDTLELPMGSLRLYFDFPFVVALFAVTVVDNSKFPFETPCYLINDNATLLSLFLILLLVPILLPSGFAVEHPSDLLEQRGLYLLI